MGIAVVALGLLVAVQAEARVGLTKTHGVGSAHGLRYLFGTEAPFSPPGTDTVAVCPKGEAPVGGGADIGGAPARSRITASVPFADNPPDPPIGWRAGGRTAIDTSLGVWLICQKAGLDRLQYVSEEVGISAGETRTASAPCPGGTQAISGGTWLNDSSIRQSAPFDSSDRNRRPDDGWRAIAKGGADIVGTGTLQVIAVCLDSHRGEVGYVRNSARVKRAKSLKATCPRSKSVAGGGWSIRGADNFANASKPGDSRADRRRVPDDRWVSTLVNSAPETGRKRGIVHAICLG